MLGIDIIKSLPSNIWISFITLHQDSEAINYLNITYMYLFENQTFLLKKMDLIYFK